MIREFQLLLIASALLLFTPTGNSQVLPGDFPKITTDIYDQEALGDGKIFLTVQKNYEGV